MGGIGKTTLARNIFDYSLIDYHFHVRVWTTISQEYHLKGIFFGILLSLTPKTDEAVGHLQRSYLPEREDDDFIQSVYRSLKGKRYFIVLDDMWITEAWDQLRMCFPVDNNGSRIIITTRLRNVAEHASSSPIHLMHFLDGDESWNLLQEKVFGEEESCPPELKEIGKIIAKNCGGLPLAIVVVAGIIAKVAMPQSYWENVAYNVSAVANTDGSFSKILNLSYDHLPNHLKICFIYMGSFPEDCEIPVSNLIKLWVAEGFLKTIESKSLEEAAEGYLEDLVKRNLVLMSKKTWTGRFRSCGVHDLVRDLCIRKAEEEKFLVVAERFVNSRGTDIQNMRLLVNHFRREVEVSNSFELPAHTILQNFLGKLSSAVVSCSRLVRVLVVPYMWLHSFQGKIAEMFHVRYLAVIHDDIGDEPLVLPSAISKLLNLQTLIIHGLATILPKSPVTLDIWKLPQLRHIILKGNMLLIPPPPRIGPVLENLQTVSKLINFKFTRKAIAMIPNLKELKLVYTSREWSKLCLENIVHLHQLEVLKLDLHGTGNTSSLDAFKISVPFPVLYGFPTSLKKLSLRECRPPLDDMSLIGSLPNLEVLKLTVFNFRDGCWETKKGEFKRLKFLRINWSNIMDWRTESSHFPLLEHLIIKYCRVLEEIPCEIGAIGTLKVITVDKCSQTAAGSALSNQEEQESMGNELVVTILDEFC